MLSTRNLVLTLIAAAFACNTANAQEFPYKLIRIVVPNDAGTPLDLVARKMAPEMSKVLGQSMIIENKPGAGQQLGYEYVAKQAPADGHTIAAVIVQSMVSLMVIRKDPGFDPLTDLPPVIGLAEAVLTFVSSSKYPWKTFNELTASAKATPGKLNYGTSGLTSKLLAEVIRRDLALDIVEIPYKGAAPYLQGLVSGEVHMGFISGTDIVPYVDRLRVLAVSGERRNARYPSAPTFAELGYPQIGSISYSLNVRAGTPKAAVDKIYAAASRALQQPEVKEIFTKIDLEVVGESTQLAEKRLASLGKLFPEIGRAVGIKPQ